MAAAACLAAQQIASSGASAAAAAALPDITPTMAIEILRRLDRRGVLQRQQAVLTGQLVAAAEAAVNDLALPVLHLGLQLLAAVLQLQQQIQAAGKAPQLDLGAAAAVAAGCGSSVLAVFHSCMETQSASWQLLSRCLQSLDSDAIEKVLVAADDRSDMLGVDAASSCLALLQAGPSPSSSTAAAAAAAAAPLSTAAGLPCEPLQQLAWRLLLHPYCLNRISHASSSGSEDDDMPEYGVNDDPVTFLVQVGLRYDMAAALTCPRPWQPHLLHWALLLAHTAQLPGKASRAQRRLTQALRDIPDLVSELLDRVVDLIGLSSSKKPAAASANALLDTDLSSTSSAVRQVTAPVPPVLSAAAQAQLSAKLQQIGSAGQHQQWALATALSNIGLPTGHHSWRLLAAAVYRSVLCLLPASARLWFSDLRDRSKVTAVEAYTTKYESPALLAAEFAAIKRDAAGSSGEVGGSCSFRVKASPAAREVTAVLEIEDGATLELQVKLPAVAPLKAAEVECRNKVCQ